MSMHYRFLLLAGLLAGFATVEVAAHEVQIAEDVGATLHIEPNDIAQAGVPTEVWFALTQAGGTVIPLAACDCRLTLYEDETTAIAQPPLTAVAAEGFQAIPGATVTFPEVGSYELVLAGRPQQAGQFSPFELRFEVTVASRAAGASVQEPPAEDATPATAESPATAPASGESSSTVESGDPAAETAIAPASETSPPAATSTGGRIAAIAGGAIVILGLGIAFIGGRRSSGDKQP